MNTVTIPSAVFDVVLYAHQLHTELNRAVGKFKKRNKTKEKGEALCWWLESFVSLKNMRQKIAIKTTTTATTKPTSMTTRVK